MARIRLIAMLAATALVLAACDGSTDAGRSRSVSGTSRSHGPSSARPAPGASSSSTGPASSTTTDPRASLPDGAPGTRGLGGAGATTTTTAAAGTPSSAGDMDSGHGVIHYEAGQTGTLWDPSASIPLATVTVSAPTFATSDSDGDNPQFGYFATFTVTVTDIAPSGSADDITPDSDNFYVEEPDGGRYGNGVQPNVQQGNGYAAELPNDLGTDPTGRYVDLLPGQSSTGTVVVDVPSEHGQLVFQGSDDDLVDGTWAY